MSEGEEVTFAPAAPAPAAPSQDMSEIDELNLKLSNAEARAMESAAHLKVFHAYLKKFSRTTELANYLLDEQSKGEPIPQTLLSAERQKIQEDKKEKRRKREEETQKKLKSEQQRLENYRRVNSILFTSSYDALIWKKVFSYLDFQEKGLAGYEDDHDGEFFPGEISCSHLCRIFSVVLAFPKDRGWSVNHGGPWSRRTLSNVIQSINCFPGLYDMDVSKISKISLGEGVFRIDPPKEDKLVRPHLIQFQHNICSSHLAICGAGMGKTTIVGAIILDSTGPSLYREKYRKQMLPIFQPADIRFENLTITNPRGSGVEICDYTNRSVYSWGKDNAFVPPLRSKLSLVFDQVEITNCGHDGIRINYLMDGKDLFTPPKEFNMKPRKSFNSPYQQGLNKLLDIRSESGFTVAFVNSLIHHNGTWGVNLQGNHRILLENTKIFYNYLGGVHVEEGKRILRFPPKQKEAVVGEVKDNGSEQEKNVEIAQANDGEKKEIDESTIEEEFLTEAVDEKGRTEFYFLCQKGKRDEVESYLKDSQGVYIDERGLYINHRQQDGWTPLYIACRNGYIDIVRLLLEVDSINVNLADKQGLTPLFIACKNNHHLIVDLLLAVDSIDVNCECKDNGWSVGYTPLLSCFMHEDMKFKERDEDQASIDQASVLERLKALERRTIFQQLLKHPNIQVNKALILEDKPGLTALMVASYLGDYSAVKRLLQHPSIDISLMHENKTARDWTGCAGLTKRELHLCCMNGCTLCYYFYAHGTPPKGINERREKIAQLITLHEEQHDFLIEDVQPGLIVVKGVNSEVFKNGCLYEFKSGDIVSCLLDNRATTVGPTQAKRIRQNTTFGRVFVESISHLSPCGVRIVGNGTRMDVHLPKDHQIIRENNKSDLDCLEGGKIQYLTESDPLLEEIKQQRSVHVSKGFVVVPSDYWCLEDAVHAARQSNGQITRIFLSNGEFRIFGRYHTNKKEDNNPDVVQQMSTFLKRMGNGRLIDIDFSLTIIGNGKGQTRILGGLHFHGTTKNDLITCAVESVSICNPPCLLNERDLPKGWKKDGSYYLSEKDKRKICPVCYYRAYDENEMKIHCRAKHPEHILDKPEGTRNRIPNAWIGILSSEEYEHCMNVCSYNNGCCVNVSEFTSITLKRCQISNSQYGFLCGQRLDDAYINEFSHNNRRENPLPKQKYIRALLEECHFHDILLCENRKRFYKSEDPPNDPGAAITVHAGTIQINQCSIKKNGGNGIHISGLCTKAILTNVVVQHNKSAGLNVYNGGIAEIYGSRTDISANRIGVNASFDYSKGTFRNQYEEKSFVRPKYPSTVLMFLPPSKMVVHDNRVRRQDLKVCKPGARSVTEGNYLYTNVDKKCSPNRQCKIFNVGSEAEAEYQRIHAKIQASKDRLRTESCVDPIVCWLAPNKNNTVCPIHGKSVCTKEKDIDSYYGRNSVFDAMSFAIQESDVKQLYEERIPRLSHFLRKKFPPPPPPPPPANIFDGSRRLAVDIVFDYAEHWPPTLYLRSDTRSKIFEVFATPDEIDALQREYPKGFASNTTEKTTVMEDGVLRTIKSKEEADFQCFYCQRNVRKGGFSRTQWLRRRRSPPKCLECLEPCNLVRYLNPWSTPWYSGDEDVEEDA